MPDQKIQIHTAGVIPYIVDKEVNPDVPWYLIGSTMIHTDALSGDDPVTILAGPLQVTTTSGAYYLIQFHEDESIWLCYPGDLRPVA